VVGDRVGCGRASAYPPAASRVLPWTAQPLDRTVLAGTGSSEPDQAAKVRRRGPHVVKPGQAGQVAAAENAQASEHMPLTRPGQLLEVVLIHARGAQAIGDHTRIA
jgi:hypothetical protein